jgi:predicted MFS family arabinose efflux permease
MAVYRNALNNRNLILSAGIIFLIGASVYGSFSYVGKYVSVTTGYSILTVGLILTFSDWQRR